MKKVVGLFTAVLMIAFVPAVNAEETKSIVIVDTAVDTSVVKVAYEVCVMEEKRCPNKQAFMEGPGSATLPKEEVYLNGFGHGTMMALTAKSVDPNVNIIFIRIVPQTNTKTLGIYSDNTVAQAMNWVIANKTKFNIVAVSTSFSSNKSISSPKICTTTNALRNNIIKLQLMGVGSFFAAGNEYKKVVYYPACISEAIAVGAVNADGFIELYSNTGDNLDFYALGTYDTVVGRAMGTSPATAALATYWAKNYKGGYQTTYDYLKVNSNSLIVKVQG